MRFREWFGENIGYRFFGCAYNRSHDQLFDFIKSKVPRKFLHRKALDLGCGDGGNTLRVARVFQTNGIEGYDHNSYLLDRARRRGIKVKATDLNKGLPKGELATFTFSLHHLKNKEKVLREATENFDFVFLCEPINDLWHRLFDFGKPMSEKEWIKLFDKVLKDYKLYRCKNTLIVFWEKI